MSIDDFRAKLEAYLTEASQQTVTITQMQPLAGGASRETWLFEATFDDGAPQKLVMRKDLPTSMHEDALTRREEFLMMQAAHESGVKVAQVRYLCEDTDVLGLPFFIMDYVEGVSIGRKVVTMPELETARQALPEQLAEQLALIHQVDLKAHHIDFLPTYSAEATIDHAYSVLDSLGLQIPAFEFALRWARHNAPTDEEITFIHGDFRIGNMLVDAQGLAAVIDWEFAHIGDPLEEIGYLCMRDWRFGQYHLHAGGLSPRERFIRAYEGYSGRTVNRSAVDWWEIVGNIRWGVICLAQANRHLSGADPSVELASLGRRSAEMQLEALRLIEKVGV